MSKPRSLPEPWRSGDQATVSVPGGASYVGEVVGWTRQRARLRLADGSERVARWADLKRVEVEA